MPRARDALPLVAIIGRPNVGKSTLLNRLIKKREAVVHDLPGVTRDRIYADCDWRGREFLLVDTGGIVFSKEDELTSSIRKQAEVAIKEADLILFVVDVKAGITLEDEEIASLLRSLGKKTILVANKVENLQDEALAFEFLNLGLGEPVIVSALHGVGTGDLLDKIVENLPEKESTENIEVEAAITLVGRPNVGKSSTLNRILGEERSVISDIPGTTRDAVDSYYQFNGKIYRIIDTAGIKKKSDKEEPLFFYSFLRALRAIERSDVSLFLIDASEGVTKQDQKIAELIEEKGNACIILLNKWDLVDTEDKRKKIYASIERKLYFLNYAPFLHISAKTGRNINKIFQNVEQVLSEYRKRIRTSELNKWMENLKQQGYTVVSGAKKLKVYYCVQTDVEPPEFVFFVNDKSLVKKNYKKFLENRLRESFGFTGTPIKIYFRNSE
ncbi:MAG: ribosome biogenesis GTPase Der [Actinobacteria bacterium]|nr:ribosome biogenesis GTPase Der [Actinomycetota bacterium]